MAARHGKVTFIGDRTLFEALLELLLWKKRTCCCLLCQGSLCANCTRPASSDLQQTKCTAVDSCRHSQPQMLRAEAFTADKKKRQPEMDENQRMKNQKQTDDFDG